MDKEIKTANRIHALITIVFAVVMLARLSLFALHSGNILHIDGYNYLKTQGRIL